MIEEKKAQLNNNVKFTIITLGMIALIQLCFLGFIFKDELVEIVSNFTPISTEVLVYPLEPVQVNLESTDRGNYLKAKINLEYSNKKYTNVIDESVVKIQAFVIETLRSKTLDEINTVDKTKILGEEVKKGINEILDVDAISEIYFIEFLYQ